MNTVARLLPVICAVGISGVLAADPVVSEADEPPSQPAAATPPQPVAQSPAVAPTGPGAMRAATPDPSSSGKPDVAAQPGGAATSSVTANAQPVANQAGRKILVDDTVTDAQLKQILSKGYKPASQARGNEVYYCRSERELGSRFENQVCKTAAQILQDEQGSKEAATYVQRTGASRERTQ